MYIPGDQPDALDALLDYYHGLCESAPSLPEGISLPLLPGKNVEGLAAGCTLQVQEGVVDLLYEERIAIILQPGDLFTVPDHSAWSITMRSEESGALRLITPNELQRAHQSPDWAWFHTRLLTAQNQALTLAFAASNRHGMRPTAGFRRLKAGDVIIREATASDEVFTLMRGSARVEVAGHAVGRVDEGEIFGVLSALTQGSHTATVIAETNVTLMSVPSDEFISLVQAQPETFMRLLRTLSRHIDELNQQLVGALNHKPEAGRGRA
jgi:hypothetical protein